MKDNNKIILFYVINKQHIENFKILINYFKNFNCIFILENKIKMLNKNYLEDNNINFIDEDLLNKFIIKNNKLIDLIIFSTSQIRPFPFELYSQSIKFNIKTISIQETFQFFLHEGDLNNYLLPTDYIFCLSSYEKNKFIEYKYNSNTIINTGCYYYINYNSKNIYKKLNTSNKKKILLILNASNETYINSVENKKLQLEIINNIKKNLPKDHILIVKLHPSDNKINISNNKNTYIVNKTFDKIEEYIISCDLVITTGYTQSIFECLYLHKKIFFIKLDNSYILYNYVNKNNVIKLDQLKNIFDNNYSFKKNEFKELYDINFEITQSESLNKTLSQINKIINLKNFNKNFLSLLEFYLLSLLIKNPDDSNIIFNMILNTYPLSSDEIFDFNIINKINNHSITLTEFKFIFIKFKDEYIINLITFCFFNYIVKKNIDIKNTDISFFKIYPDYFLFHSFSNYINSFLNFIYIDNYNEYSFFSKKLKFNRSKNLFKLFDFLKKNKIFSNYKLFRIILIKFEYFLLKI